jgi:hypothetical protein
MKNLNIIVCIVLLSLLSGCGAPALPTLQAAPTPIVVPPTETPIPTATLPPTATATPRPRIKPGDSIGFIHGIAYIASHVPDWAYPLSDQSLQALRDTGADWVSLNANISHWDDPELSRQATIHAIQEAHRLGLNVLLRPKFEDTDLQGYHNDLAYSIEQWQAWADRYTEELLPYAQIAEEYEVEIFAVGYEMRATEPEEAHWRTIIQKVREVYSGPLTYSSLPNEEADVKWWDALDFIGVDGYYNLSSRLNPSEDELKSAWVPYLNNLEALSKKYSKQVIFTEIGYPSTVTAAENPGNWMYGSIDLELQARLYKVLFEVIQDKPWINGVFIWAWDETPYQGGACDFEHSPKGKPAENVMREFFGAPAVSLPDLDPHLPIFDESQINTYSIFEDSFHPLMDPNWSWNTKYEMTTTPEPLGKNALQVTMTNNAGLVFYLGEFDPVPYQWLEFYIYREDDQSIPLRITANYAEGTSLINRQIRSCWYAEGGVVPKDTWTRVLIPLEHLNINLPIQEITLVKWEDGDLKFWLDNVRLVGMKK